jgi:hypothetical protein
MLEIVGNRKKPANRIEEQGDFSNDSWKECFHYYVLG